MLLERPSLGFPSRPATPIRSLWRRIAVACSVVLLVALITWLGRDGYRDADGNGVSWLDAIYYSTVTVTTTGYGDITPISPGARAVTAFVVTPLRVIFLIVLVGTTLALLTERYRQALAESRWRKRVNGHTVVAGYGTKGRGAAASLLASGVSPSQIVIIDSAPAPLEAARANGFTTVLGDATRTAVLTEAMIPRARAVIVTCGGDDTAALVTLSVRELNGSATIAAAADESENVHLLHQSGATTALVSSEASGRLLGLATSQPDAVAVLEDILVAGEGLQLVERRADVDEVGGPPLARPGQLPIALVRDGARLSFDEDAYQSVRAGDVIVSLQTR